MIAMNALHVIADDFGMSEYVSQGILYAFENGIVNRASVLINFESSNNLLNRSIELGLPLGLHANLTTGPAILGKSEIPTLVDDRGSFFDLTGFIYRYFAGKISKKDIIKELDAQFNLLRSKGIMVEHLNTHHHIHCLPGLTKLFADLAIKNKIQYFRRISYPCRKLNSGLYPFLQQSIVWASGRFLEKAPGLTCPDRFYGFELVSSKDKKMTLIEILKNLGSGVNEIMCHPAFPGLTNKHLTNYIEGRNQELEALCDPEVVEIYKKMCQQK